MVDIDKEEYQVELRMIKNHFAYLVKMIKADLQFEEQQKYEWSIPDYSMFEDLLLACIREK